MENREPRKTRKRKKLTRRAAVLYLTLAVCVLGAGVAARTAMNFRMKPQSDEARDDRSADRGADGALFRRGADRARRTEP